MMSFSGLNPGCHLFSSLLSSLTLSYAVLSNAISSQKNVGAEECAYASLYKVPPRRPPAPLLLIFYSMFYATQPCGFCLCFLFFFRFVCFLCLLLPAVSGSHGDRWSAAETKQGYGCMAAWLHGFLVLRHYMGERRREKALAVPEPRWRCSGLVLHQPLLLFVVVQQREWPANILTLFCLLLLLSPDNLGVASMIVTHQFACLSISYPASKYASVPHPNHSLPPFFFPIPVFRLVLFHGGHTASTSVDQPLAFSMCRTHAEEAAGNYDQPTIFSKYTTT